MNTKTKMLAQMAVGNDILRSLGLEDLPEPQRSQILDSIQKRMEDFVMQRAIDILTANDVTEIEKMSDGNASQEEIMKFLTDHIENFPIRMAEAIIEFQRSLVNETVSVLSELEK